MPRRRAPCFAYFLDQPRPFFIRSTSQAAAIFRKFSRSHGAVHPARRLSVFFPLVRGHVTAVFLSSRHGGVSRGGSIVIFKNGKKRKKRGAWFVSLFTISSIGSSISSAKSSRFELDSLAQRCHARACERLNSIKNPLESLSLTPRSTRSKWVSGPRRAGAASPSERRVRSLT